MSISPTFIDLFAGCGGASLGFLEAGFRCLLAVDFDSSAVHTYNRNLKGLNDAGAIQLDLSSLSSHEGVKKLLAERGIEPGSCDVLVGGPPCQSFSIVGRNKIKALMNRSEAERVEWEETNRKRTSLFEAYALFLEVLAPRWFFFENVPAIRSHSTYSAIERRFRELHNLDGSRLEYSLVPDAYWASDYGVPQRRRRFIMVGYRKDAGVQRWIRPVRSRGPRVSEALDDLPPVESGSRDSRLPYAGPPRSDYQILMRAALPESERHLVSNHVCRDHNPDDVALFAKMAPGAKFSDPAVQQAIREVNPDHKLIKYSVDKFQDKLHKLNGYEPAWTVTAHLQKDCYKFIHHSQPRTITVREAARLQSFPDRFVFPEALGSAFRLIGNAVPPLLAQAFAESFIESDLELSRRADPVQRMVPKVLWMQIAPLLGLGRHSKSRGRAPLSARAVVAAGLSIELEGRDLEEIVQKLNGAKVSTYRKHLRHLKASGKWGVIVATARRHLHGDVFQEILPFS